MARNAPVPSSGPLDATTGAQRAGIIFPALERAHDGGAGSDGIYTSQEYVNHAWRGVRLLIDLTNRHTTGTLAVKIQLRDPASLNWVDLAGATTGSLATVATTTLTVYPGVSETPNIDIADPLGVRWRVHATVGTAHVDFSVGGDYLA